MDTAAGPGASSPRRPRGIQCRATRLLRLCTSVGNYKGGNSRASLGMTGAGPTVIITDIGVMRPDPVTGEFVLTALHPGRTAEEAIAATGWALKVSPEVMSTEPPTATELQLLRALQAGA